MQMNLVMMGHVMEAMNTIPDDWAIKREPITDTKYLNDELVEVMFPVYRMRKTKMVDDKACWVLIDTNNNPIGVFPCITVM